jgi:hypothetical protein
MPEGNAEDDPASDQARTPFWLADMRDTEGHSSATSGRHMRDDAGLNLGMVFPQRTFAFAAGKTFSLAEPITRPHVRAIESYREMAQNCRKLAAASRRPRLPRYAGRGLRGGCPRTRTRRNHSWRSLRRCVIAGGQCGSTFPRGLMAYSPISSRSSFRQQCPLSEPAEMRLLHHPRRSTSDRDHQGLSVSAKRAPATSVTCSPPRSAAAGFLLLALSARTQIARKLDLKLAVLGDETDLVDETAQPLGRLASRYFGTE